MSHIALKSQDGELILEEDGVIVYRAAPGEPGYHEIQRLWQLANDEATGG